MIRQFPPKVLLTFPGFEPFGFPVLILGFEQVCRSRTCIPQQVIMDKKLLRKYSDASSGFSANYVLCLLYYGAILVTLLLIHARMYIWTTPLKNYNRFNGWRTALDPEGSFKTNRDTDK